MSSSFRPHLELLRQVMQRIALCLLIAAAIGLSGYSIACATGIAPWPQIGVITGENAQDWGPPLTLAATGLALSLLFFVPGQARIMALETSHRSFHMGMQDVARAYALAHASDRAGAFTLKREFDSVRERIAFLRDHPDLSELEPSVLELAAQMSHVSNELATVYSDRNVDRARDFLVARQQEVETFNERLEAAKQIVREVRPWIDTLELEEATARSQLDRLKTELREVLPEIWATEPPAHPAPETADTPALIETTVSNVTRLERHAAE